MALIILAAFGPELAGFEKSPRTRVATVGVGLIDAALGTSRVLAEQRPSEVILVGTAGAYSSSGLAIGDVVVATRVLLVSSAATRSAGALLMHYEPITFASSHRFDAKPAVVANTLAVTTDDALALELAGASSAEVEHLEAYAVARACMQANVPLTVLLGIANIVGSHGRDEWRANHERVAQTVCDVVLRSPTTTRSPA